MEGKMKRRWLVAIVPVCLLLGFAESLGVFFWGHLHEVSGQVWLSELLSTLLLGTLFSAVFVYLLGLALLGLRELLRWANRGRVKWLLFGLDYLASLPVLVVVYLVLRLCISVNSGSTLAWIIYLSATAVVVFLVLFFRKFLLGYSRWAPVALAFFATWGVWFALGAPGSRRFGVSESLWVWVQASVPVFLLALAWSLSSGGGWRRKSAAWGGAVLLCALCGFLWMPPERPRLPERGDKPNVILLVVDTLRADRVWGDGAVMPRLHELAEQGVYYRRAYTPIPKTQQSVSSIMTGLYPWHHGVRELYQPLGSEHDTLAEKFSRAGYHTAAFVHNAWINYGMGHEQGFSEYHDYDRIESFSYLLYSLLPVYLLDRTVGRKAGGAFRVDGRVLTDWVVDWLDRGPPEPYFVWVQYMDPHWPYLPPQEAVGASDQDYQLAEIVNKLSGRRVGRHEMIFQARKHGITDEQVAAATRLYSGEAKYVDQQIGRVLEQFKDKPPPLILVTADHGESLGEHQYYFQHGAFTYEVCLRVPLAIWWPGRIKGGRVVESPVMTVDIAPTLIRLAGIEAGSTDGRMLPGVDGVVTEDAARVIPFEGDVRMNDLNDRIPVPGLPGKWRGVIEEGKKLITVLTKKGLKYQIYDLEEDPGERHNLYPDRKKLVQPMVDVMTDKGMKLGGGPAGEGTTDKIEELSEGEIERLRSLGYME